MTPYSAMVVFAVGIFLSTFIFNSIAMKRPVSGTPVSISAYFKGGFPIHLVGVLGGVIWGLGNALNLIAAGKAGAAISYGLGQGAAAAAALWGVFGLKGAGGGGRRVDWLLGWMFALFVAEWVDYRRKYRQPRPGFAVDAAGDSLQQPGLRIATAQRPGAELLDQHHPIAGGIIGQHRHRHRPRRRPPG